MTQLRRFRGRLIVENFLGPSRRLFALVIGVGFGGGLIGAAYVGTLHVLQRGLWPTHWANSTHLVILVAVGLAVGVLTKLLGSPGDVELLVNNIHVLGGSEDQRELRSLIPVSLLCIAAGGGMGPEAPLVQTTGNFGSWVATRAGLQRDEMRVLTITGMAAAFTVLFGAPLGSAVFALEILHRRGLEYYEALMPAVIGSLTGYAVYVVLTGAGLQSVWTLPGVDSISVADIGWAVLCGAGGAVIAVAFTYLTKVLQWLFRHLSPTVRPVAGGLALAGLAFWSPYALTFGEAQLDPMLVRRATVVILVTAVLAKLCGAAVTLSSGWRGGFIIPLFFMGAALGRLFHLWFPHTHEAVLVSALMVAANVGVTKTPIGSTLVVTEMAGVHLLPTTLLAAVVALFLTSEVSLIHTQRERENALTGVEPGEAKVDPAHGAAVDAPRPRPEDGAAAS
jgi:H+/Cl- antiporter ClcA